MFAYSETQKMIEGMVQDFCIRELEPVIDELERGTRLPFEFFEKMSSAFGFRDMYRGSSQAAAKGSSETGQFRDDPVIMQIIMKECSKISPGYALSLGASLYLCGSSIMGQGTEEQCRRFGIPVMVCDKVGAWALTEPGAGSDAFSLKTRAVYDQGRYILSGTKTFITNAPFANVFVVYARVIREDKPGEIRAFVFDREDVSNFATGKPLEKMGMKDSPTGELFMDEMELTADHLLGGEENLKARHAREVLFRERSVLPAMAVGIIEKCLEVSVKYARERCQFGRPIGSFQAIQLKIADMYTDLEIARNFMFKLAWLLTQKNPDPSIASAAKLFCAKAAVRCSLEAIQILGGYGYTREYRVEKLMRDAKLLEIGGGTNEIQQVLIARSLLNLKKQ